MALSKKIRRTSNFEEMLKKISEHFKDISEKYEKTSEEILNRLENIGGIRRFCKKSKELFAEIYRHFPKKFCKHFLSILKYFYGNLKKISLEKFSRNCKEDSDSF